MAMRVAVSPVKRMSCDLARAVRRRRDWRRDAWRAVREVVEWGARIERREARAVGTEVEEVGSEMRAGGSCCESMREGLGWWLTWRRVGDDEWCTTRCEDVLELQTDKLESERLDDALDLLSSIHILPSHVSVFNKIIVGTSRRLTP
jgi:hypothetical protein